MKRKITNFVLLFAFGCATLFSIGCSGGGNNQDPNRGFDVLVTAANIPTIARVQGQFLNGSGNFGSQNTFNIQTNGGVARIPNLRVPGTWRFTYGPDIAVPSLCLGVQTVDRSVNLGSQVTLPCVPRFFSFTASPNTVDAFNPPATVDIGGNGSDTLYGTPMVATYNEFGNVVASTSATQLLYTDGSVSGVRFSASDLSQVYDGTYTIAVHNVRADGSWEMIGAAAVTIYGNPPPPPDDGGGGCGYGQQSPNRPILPC